MTPARFLLLIQPALPCLAGIAAIGAVGAEVLAGTGVFLSPFFLIAVCILAAFEVVLIWLAAKACGKVVLRRGGCLGVPYRAVPCLLVVFGLGVLLGWGIQGLFAPLPITAQGLLCLIANTTVGFYCLAASAVVCVWGQNPRDLTPPAAEAVAEVSRVAGALSPRRLTKSAFSCLLSFVLAFSLLGNSFPAWADEGGTQSGDVAGKPLVTDADSGLGVVPGTDGTGAEDNGNALPGEGAVTDSGDASDGSVSGKGSCDIDSGVGAASPGTGADGESAAEGSCGAAAGGTDSGSTADGDAAGSAAADAGEGCEADNEPEDIVGGAFPLGPAAVEGTPQAALAPVDYYDQPETEGKLISFDGTAAVYNLGGGSFRTVIGGAATAYLDGDGEACEIDNTLVAAPAPAPVGEVQPQLVPQKTQLRAPAQGAASGEMGVEPDALASDSERGCMEGAGEVSGGAASADVSNSATVSADSPVARVAGSVPEAWEPKANGVRVRIPSQMGEGEGVTYERDGWSAALTPLTGDFSLARAEGEAVRFTEVLPGVDWQYTFVGSLVKEDVVLNRAVKPFRILEKLYLSEGLVALQQGDGIAVYREKDVRVASGTSDGRGTDGAAGQEGAGYLSCEESGSEAVEGTMSGVGAAEGSGLGEADALQPRSGARALLTLTAPVAIDAAGQLDNHLRLALKEAGDSCWMVEVLPDWEWLLAPKRAYPVRIDPAVNIAPSAMRVTVAEQYAPTTHVGENGYAFAGYDDGVKTGSGAFRDGEGLGIGRLYVAIDYDFKNIMDEARIDSATLDLHQRWYYSDGKTEFGLYRNLSSWKFDKLTWNSQKAMGHEFICSRNALKKSGYISFDVRTPVANWIAGVWPQNGLCVKATDERNMQCEIFDQRDTDYPPKLSIDWTIPDPVPDSTSINATTAKLRPVTEADIFGKLRFDGAFVDGVATPRSVVAYELLKGSSVVDGGGAYASRSYQYPNSSTWEPSLPSGTKYRDKVSNWQSKLFTGMAEDTVYQIRAHAEAATAVGKYALTDKFLIYRATAKDTLPSIAAHYGTTVDQLARDNGVQDMLVVGGNTIFVRNPKTAARYAPKGLTDTQKRRIDSALMGRNMHCEYGFEPVNLNTGNFTMSATDAEFLGSEGAVLVVERTYNAMAEQTPSVFGPGWASPFDEHLGLEVTGAVCWSFGDGRVYWFDPAGTNRYTCSLLPGAVLSRIAYKSGSRTLHRWEAKLSDGMVVKFDCNGLLTERVNPEGLSTKFTRDGLGRLTAVTGPFARS